MRRFCITASIILLAGALLMPRAAVMAPPFVGLAPPDRTAADVPTTAGLGVNTRSGNLHLRRRLFVLPGRARLPLDLYVVYNADHRAVSSPVGPGWGLSLAAHYTRNSAGDVIIVWGDGHQTAFASGPGGFTASAGVFSELGSADGVLTLTTASGRSYVFADPVSRKITSIEDPNGNALRFSYDAESRLAQMTDAGGRDLGFTYDALGRLVRVTDANLTPPRTVELAYDADGRLASLQDPLGATEVYAYDGPDALLASVTDRRGNTATITYSIPVWDAGTRLVREVSKAGSVHAFTYDATTRTTAYTDPVGNVTRYTYDAEGRLTTVTDTLSNTATLEWDTEHRLVSFQDRTGATRTFTYDARGNLLSTTDAVGATHSWTYDAAFSRRLTYTNALGGTATDEYDARGNLVKTTDALGHSATMTVNSAGQPTRFVDRAGATRTYAYDGAGNLTRIVDQLGKSERTAYDAAGRVIGWTDARGKVWGRTLDAGDHVLSRTNPLGKTWTYTYDANGNLATHTDAKGQVTTYTYDALNRLTRRTFAHGTTAEFTYDAAGNVLTASDDDSDYSFTYDALRRETGYTDENLGLGVTYEYDAVGRLVRKTSPGSLVVQYEYDAAGRRTSVTGPGGRSTFTTDAAGHVLTNTRPNGVVSTFEYDLLGQLERIEHVGPAQNTLQSFVYTRDAVGRITRTDRESGEIVRMTYDAVGRVTQEKGGSGAEAYTFDFTYDAVGNLTRSVGTFVGFGWDVAFAHDDASRTVSEDTATIEHDDNGNRTKQVYGPGNEDVFTYDARNRLSSAQPSWTDTPVRYAYDVFDRLISRTDTSAATTRTMYGSPTPVAILDAAGKPKKIVETVCIYGVRDADTNEQLYTHPGGNRPLSPVFWILPNTLVTDDRGQTVAAWTYSADGSLRTADMETPGSVPDFIWEWMNGVGGFDDGTAAVAIRDGVAWDPWKQEPLNPGVEQGNSVPGYTSAATVRFTDWASGDAKLASYTADFASISAYTYVGITNMESSANTITVAFHGPGGAAVASSSSSVKPGATWILTPTTGSPSGIAGPGAFEGSARPRDSAGELGDFVPAVAFPVQPGRSSPFALRGFPLLPITVTGC